MNQEERAVHPATLQALRCLRDNIPSLLRAFENYETNINGNVNGNEKDEDDKRSYWMKPSPTNAMFHEDGTIEQLDLGGQRLHRLILINDNNDSNGNGMDSSTVIKEAFEELCKSMTTLNLGGTDLPVKQLTKGLLSITPLQHKLQKLYLGGNSLQNEGCSALSTILPNFHNLALLDLRYNDISHIGIQSLSSSSLPSLPALTTLHLEGNAIGDEGAQHLATVLGCNQTLLTHLFLGANQIGPKGASSLAQAISTNRYLYALHLQGNFIGSLGAQRFTHVLHQLWSDASNPVDGDVDDDGFCASEEKCARVREPVLKHLYVDDNGIGKEHSQKLARALRSHSVISDSAFE